MSHILGTLMLRLEYPHEFQSDYKLSIEPGSKNKSIIDIKLKDESATKWKKVLALFPSIEYAIDYIVSQQAIQFPGGLEKKIIFDIHSEEP